MKNEQRLSGEKRRALILEWLRGNDEPITASVLAERTNVSRQVIVQDVSLLKAKEEPIIATSQGYVYVHSEESNDKIRRVIACCHSPEKTLEELNLIVDHGVTVKDVTVEHPVYGEITAPLILKNRRDVTLFMEKLHTTKASLLSELTDGTHLHTLEADYEAQLDELCEALSQAGFLLSHRN